MEHFFNDSYEHYKALEDSIKSWLGTPYQHGANAKGLAVDCVHFVAGVYVESGLISGMQEPSEKYPLDWYKTRNNGTVELIKYHLDEFFLPAEYGYEHKEYPCAIFPGDILCFHISSYVTNHTAIYLTKNRIAHASTRAKAVIIESLEGYQAYLKEVFSFPRREESAGA